MDTPADKTLRPAPDGAPAAAERSPTRWPRRRVVRWVALGALALAALGGGTLFGWTRELPAFDKLEDYRPLVSTRVYGIDGSEVFEFARERRTVIPLADVPDVLKKAVLAAEDAKFYQHEGVNYLAIARCAVKGVFRGGVACGGSTITQQVVKTFLLQSDWRVKRKVKELFLAPKLEENLSKDEILYLYLNQIYFGHQRYGVAEAARFYFGKEPRALGLGEAAMIAGLVQSPMRWSPVNHPARAKERQRYVLRRMQEEGFITKAQAEAEAARPLAVRPPEADPPGAWYADAVRKFLDEKYGAERVETDGLQVDVAMDPLLQRYAEAALEADLRAVDKRQGYRGPLMHLDPKQLEAARPIWKEKLQAAAAEARPGEALVWDLRGVKAADLEPGDEDERGVRRMIRVRTLEAGEVYAAVVSAVGEKDATVDLGGAQGVLPLSDVAWARKWNPTSATAAPKRMASVVAPGDVALVRVMQGKLSPERAARAGKPVALSLEQTPRVQGALVAIDPQSRGVRALVGGYDFATSQFNRALQAKRQPGSAFKPFVWGAAVESVDATGRHPFTPSTVVYDTPDVYRDRWTGKEWKPKNFERDEFDGALLLKAALAHSKNTVSVKLVDALGVERVSAFARRLGIASELPQNLTLALGTGEVYPIELVNAYTTIAAHGKLAQPQIVLRVRDRNGTLLDDFRAQPPAASAAGEVPAVVPASATAPAAAAAPPAPDATAPAPDAAAFPVPETGTRADVAFVLQGMMRDVVEYGTGAAAKALGRPVAAKTGTAQEHRDAWFVGFTPELAAGVWVGFDDHAPLGPREPGAGAALPAWLSFMEAALGARPPAEFPEPEGIELARIDPATGLLAPANRADAPLVPFLAGTAPRDSAPEHGTSAPQNFFMDDR